MTSLGCMMGMDMIFYGVLMGFDGIFMGFIGIYVWLVVTGTCLFFQKQLGMSSSQLTNSYFSGGLKPPTSYNIPTDFQHNVFNIDGWYHDHHMIITTINKQPSTNKYLPEARLQPFIP